MSLDDSVKLSKKERKRNLGKALEKIYPEEELGPLVETLLIASEKGVIRNDEIMLEELVKEDLLMFLERERVLIPYRTSKTIAWEDRLLTFKPDEKYHASHITRCLIKHGELTGELDPYYALKRYLCEIGEADPGKILCFLRLVAEKVQHGRVSAEDLLTVAVELNLEPRMGTIIAVLKGGGVISPCLRDPSELKYEVNPLLLKSLSRRK